MQAPATLRFDVIQKVSMRRKMVQGLHRIGFRVVLDVVYNHTFHSLQDGGLISIIQAVAQIQCGLPLYVYQHMLGSARRVRGSVAKHVMMGAGGNSPYAVLDKLVPGYYHRRTEQGDICASCCCNNTATEHLMAERLVIDDITHWARTYKVRLPAAQQESAVISSLFRPNL